MALTKVGSGVLNIDDLYGFRNRIINGDMRIDQRNAGAAMTTASGFPVDRFLVALTSNVGTFSAQQDSSAPTGFTTSTKITVTTEDGTIASTENFAYQTWIEGNNIADLGFGTANAKTVTLSFWVRASITGTYGAVIGNSNAGTGAPNRSYVSTYTINSADTWEYKTITVPGDTSGTWQTNNLRGMIVRFGLTAGTDFQQSAGSWGTVNAFGTSAQTQMLSTLNATWYITGVQLEVGSVATPFERRPYGTELALCQRYYQKSYDQNTVPGSSVTSNFNGLIWSNGVCDTVTAQIIPFTIVLPQPMRSAISLAYWDAAGNASKFSTFTGGGFTRTDNQGGLGTTYLNSNAVISGWGTPGAGNSFAFAYVLSAEL